MYKRLNNEQCYRKFYFQDSFYAQCMDVNPMTLIQFDNAVAQVKKIIDQPIFRSARHVIATGCGDSNLAAFAVKEAFEHYLPEVEYEGVEAVELSRHYDFGEDASDTIALYISYSGEVLRTSEAMEQCKRHGVTNVAVTTHPNSRNAREADILYFTDTPVGDNNAGLRTYFANVQSVIILCAAIAELRTGKSLLSALREQVKAYHDAFFSELEQIDEFCFRSAIHWMDKKYLEICADGPMFWAGKFIQAKVIELSGDACSVIDSENYMHVNSLMYPGADIGEIVIINSNDQNVSRIAESVNAMVSKGGREVVLFSDKAPEELGITEAVHYCHIAMPPKEWNFLAPLYAFLPGAIFAGFRHTTIGEPMFRGGMDPTIFIPAYFPPVDVVEK